MKSLKFRKTLLLALIVVTTLAPVLFVDLEETGAGLVAVKLLAKIGSLAGVILLFWQLFLGFRGTLFKLIPDYVWVMDTHKLLGQYAIPLILLHPVFITVYYLIKFDRNPLLLEGDAAFKWYVGGGMLALGVIAVLVITSVFVRERMTRHIWFCVHLSSYAVLPLAFVHSFPIGMTVRNTALWQLWIVLVLVLVVFYVFRILGRLGIAARPFEVTVVKEVAPDVTHISMRPLKAPMVPAFSQFAFVRRGLKGSARPFSISGFDERTGEISVTVAADGQTSTELQQVQPGEKMYLDGPYGVFGQQAVESGRPMVMIAGGIGITVFKRMIEKLAQEPEREAYLFYGNKTRQDIVYKEEFEAMRHVKVVHVLNEEPSYEGETGLITLELMKRHLRHPLADYEFLLCGPPIMINKLEKALLEAHIPSEQIHHELFGY